MYCIHFTIPQSLCEIYDNDGLEGICGRKKEERH